MKKIILSAIFLTLALSLAVPGQSQRGINRSGNSSERLESLANRLENQTDALVNQTYDDLMRGRANRRREVRDAFLARQMNAAAELFRQMLRDERPKGELTEAAAILKDLARQAPDTRREAWETAVNLINQIEEELNGLGANPVEEEQNDLPAAGRAFWRGRVDNRVQLIITGRTVETRTIAGQTNPPGTYSFTSTMPNRELTIEVDKKDGRGKVNILQQPTRQNNYTAIIEIYDDGGGADNYQLEIIWK